jgi:hypothetical protein
MEVFFIPVSNAEIKQYRLQPVCNLPGYLSYDLWPKNMLLLLKLLLEQKLRCNSPFVLNLMSFNRFIPGILFQSWDSNHYWYWMLFWLNINFYSKKNLIFCFNSFGSLWISFSTSNLIKNLFWKKSYK